MHHQTLIHGEVADMHLLRMDTAGTAERHRLTVVDIPTIDQRRDFRIKHSQRRCHRRQFQYHHSQQTRQYRLRLISGIQILPR